MHRPENSILSCFFSPQIPPFSSGFIRNNTHLYFIYFYFVLVTFDTSKRSSHLHNDSFSRVYFLLLSCLQSRMFHLMWGVCCCCCFCPYQISVGRLIVGYLEPKIEMNARYDDYYYYTELETYASI